MLKSLAIVVTLLTVHMVSTIEPAAGQGITETLALTGDLIPGGSVAFDTFDLPRLNNKGQVAFASTLSSSARGVYRAESGMANVQIAMSSQTTPHGTFGTSSFFSNDINDAGQVAFSAAIGSGAGLRGYYVGAGGPLRQAALEGEPIPLDTPLAGISDPRYSELDSLLPLATGPILNEGGRLAFVGHIDGCEPVVNGCQPVDFDAVFTSTSSGTQIIAREGDPAPVSGGGTSGAFSDFFGSPPFVIPTAIVNNRGRVVYQARTTNPNGAGLFYTRQSLFSTTRLAIATNGQTTFPGLPGAMMVDSTRFDLNDADEVAFTAELNPQQPGEAADLGIYLWSAQEAALPGAHGLIEIARSGRILPDESTTIRVVQSRTPQLNAGGEVAFFATMSNATNEINSAVLRGDGENLDLFAETGQATPDGQRQFGTFFGDVAINNAGQVAFEADLQDSSGQFAGDGLYIADSQDLIEVIRTGQPLAGSTVERITFRGTDGINESGQVTFAATLSDGRSGVFLFTNSTLSGDYNDDGIVDAADYTVWRDNLNTPPGTLPNDSHGGVIGDLQYATWKDNFGRESTGGSLLQVTVPEPASGSLLIFTASALSFRRRVGVSSLAA